MNTSNRRRRALTAACVLTLAIVAVPVGASQHAAASSEQHGHDNGPLADQPMRRLAKRAGIEFGTAVNMDLLPTDALYRSKVAEQFSSVTPENVMKWEVVEPQRGQFNWSQADALVDFARQSRQRVRGHTLVWHNQLPSWLNEASFSADELRAILKQHVMDEAGHFRGRVYQWDVLNEAFNEDGTLRDTIWLRALGPGYIADTFRWAHEADPKAKLFYNDFTIEGIGPKSDAVYALVQQLLADGVPIGGVGFQAHLGVQYDFPNQYLENLQRFADLGVQISITEADVRMPLPVDTTKLQAQAGGFSGLLEGCLLVRACKSFTLWGFTDLHSWIPGFFTGEGAATPLDEQYQPKPGWVSMQQSFALATRGRD
jgi:endo-1,4-beta-xylanase